MITEEKIQDKFISRVVSRDAKLIYQTQEDVIRQNFTSERSQALADFLGKKPFSSQYAPGKEVYFFRVFSYLRFLDIKHSNKRSQMALRRNLAIYNRVIWGTLYHETLPDLRYGLTQDIRKSITAELQNAVKP